MLALKSFQKDFGLPTDKSGFSSKVNAHAASNVVSLLTAGCFFGAIAAAFLNDRFGRRYSLMFFSVVFLIGAAIQVGSHHALGQIYGGRVIAGLGIGGMSSITPVFVYVLFIHVELLDELTDIPALGLRIALLKSAAELLGSSRNFSSLDPPLRTGSTTALVNASPKARSNGAFLLPSNSSPVASC